MPSDAVQGAARCAGRVGKARPALRAALECRRRCAPSPRRSASARHAPHSDRCSRRHNRDDARYGPITRGSFAFCPRCWRGRRDGCQRQRHDSRLQRIWHRPRRQSPRPCQLLLCHPLVVATPTRQSSQDIERRLCPLTCRSLVLGSTTAPGSSGRSPLPRRSTATSPELSSCRGMANVLYRPHSQEAVSFS